MKRKDGISVIVPVYNTEKYLRECLDSLLKQQINNYEILLVDDGSTDNTPQICDDYAKKDKKVRVFHKENEGCAVARNFALNKARYEYITFTDADDWVTEDYLKTMYDRIKEGYDIVTIDAYEIPSGWKIEDAKYRRCFIETEKTTKKDFVMQSTEPSFLWCRCFHYKLFEKIKFPEENAYFTDSATVPILIMNAKKICHVNKPCYYYRQHFKSITRQKDDKRNFGIIRAWNRMLKEAPKEYTKEIEYAVYYSLDNFIYYRPNFVDHFYKFYQNNKKRFEQNKYIKEKIEKREFHDLSKLKLIPKKIHYFWFGGEKPEEVLRYIETWKKYAPEYEIIEWNESNCNIKENRYVKEAYENKKYAFVADYFRLKILYEEGGIYLDTDMELKKEIDFLRLKPLAFPMETDNVCAGFISSLPKNKIIKEILDSYENDCFVLEDKSYNYKTIVRRITDVLNKYYDIKYLCETEEFDDLILYSPDTFIIDVGNGKNVAVHHYKATWWDIENIVSYKYEVLKYYFETLYKEKIRKEEDEKRKREEEENRRKQEEIYENSFKRKTYKTLTKTLKKLLPKKVYNGLKKIYRKIKPTR